MEAVPGGANYWDLGLQEGHARLKYEAIDEDGNVQGRAVDLPIPEGTMDELEKLIGDGQATITVGKEFKVSEDYKTAMSTAFVKLTCNQDLKSILETREIATSLALGFAQQGFEQAQYILAKMYGKDLPAPPPLLVEVTDGEVNTESQTLAQPKEKPKMKTKPKAKEADPEPLRKQSTQRPILAGKNRPSFRR